MKKPLLFVRLALLAGSIVIAVATCRWVAETYFFDKFIYQKNTQYGYFTKNNLLSQFGKRGEDLLRLSRFKSQKQGAPNALGLSADGRYTVVVVGDSYVWGQGLRNEDRFAYILEKKLNTIIPSRVISLGGCGNDVFDYYLHYRDIHEAMPSINLYIFGLVDNDLMFNPFSDDESLKQQLMAECQRSVSIYDGKGENYERGMGESYSDSFGNQCLFREIMDLLPKSNALYLVMDYIKSDRYLHKYTQPLIDGGYYVINPNYQQTIHSYEEYTVSKAEGHPSKKMNQAYADVLFGEIQKTDSFKNEKAAYFSGRN